MKDGREVAMPGMSGVGKQWGDLPGLAEDMMRSYVLRRIARGT
jgi:hypothetical protein